MGCTGCRLGSQQAAHLAVKHYKMHNPASSPFLIIVFLFGATPIADAVLGHKAEATNCYTK